MKSKGGVFGRARPLGPPKLLFLITIVIADVLVCTREEFAQISPNQTPPQSNSTSSRSQPTNTGAPGKTAAGKTQTAQTVPGRTQTTRTERPITQSKSHQEGKQYGHGHSRGGGVGFGVGATIDLSGIGQRRPEPNPFAVLGPPPLPRTQERPEKPKTTIGPREASKSSDFAGVELTGRKAKSEIAPTDPFRDVQLTGQQAKEQRSPQ